MKNKILITGGSGYIGSLLTPMLLQKGYIVTVLDNLIFNQFTLLDCCYHKNFEFIKQDVCNYEFINNILKNFDIIIPLAAIVGAPACDLNPTQAKEVNFNSQINLIKNLSPNQVVIYPTTNSGYGKSPEGDFCNEESALQPVSSYGKHKVDIEKAFLDRGNVITFRLATVFGASPRMRIDLLVNDFVYKAIKYKSIILYEENYRRNFIHIRDVVNTFLFGIENFEKMKNQIYNVGLCSANITKRELAEKIKNHIKELYIHTSAISTDPDQRDYLVSNEKIKSLGWKTQYDLDDGIEELIKVYKIIKTNLFSNV